MIVEYDKNIRRLGVTEIMGIGDIPSLTSSPDSTRPKPQINLKYLAVAAFAIIWLLR